MLSIYVLKFISYPNTVIVLFSNRTVFDDFVVVSCWLFLFCIDSGLF